jgi:pimeloyl-ACP methyl ester carboxylesterase
VQQPTQHFFESQRLRLSCWSWGDEAGRPLILLHGKRDHARSWDGLAEALTGGLSRGRRVLAPDLRGHGDSQWAVGSHYVFADYIADLITLIDEVGGRASVLGHSGGGLIATLAAGLYPERFERVAAIEGTGAHLQHLPPAEPDALRAWVDHTRDLESRSPRRMPSVEEAAERLRRGNARLSKELALDLAAYAVREKNGGYEWKFDPWVDSRDPVELRPEEAPPVWARVRAPVLLLMSEEAAGRGVQSPDDASYFAHARALVVPDAGHWVHHDQPALVLRELLRFEQEEA